MEHIDEYEYNKKDIIGHGAFAIVFRGRERKRPDQTVAIKCINKKNLSKSQTFPEKEIEILKELHHGNVVSLLHFKETTSSLFMVMEFCNGGDLADYLHIKGTLSEDTIRFFLGQIACAMKAIHEKGIIHRDLKPQNLLLSHNSKHKVPHPNEIHLKIADFGFARFLEGDMMAATLCGSPLYMAPEVITSQHYDAKADLWSIGTIIFQCLTGSAPFKAANPPELKKLYMKARTLDPNIPPGTSKALKDLLIRLLKRNQKDRIEFDKFFSHDFLGKNLKSTSTSPMPVPSRTYSFSSDSPGERRSLSVSPLSGHMPISSPEEPSPSSVGCGPRGYSISPLAAPPLISTDRPSAAKGLQEKLRLSSGMGSSDLVEDDFVIVQPSIVSELSYETSGASINVQTTTDVITIRSNSSPIMSSSRGHSAQPKSSTSPVSGRIMAAVVRRKLPSPSERPSSLPISSSPSTSPNTGRHRVSPKQSPSSLISPSRIHAQIRHSYSSSGGSPIGSPSQRRRLLSPNQSPSLARHCILAQAGGVDNKPPSPVQVTGLSSPGSQYNPGVVHKFYKFHASPTSPSPSPPHIPRVSTDPSMCSQGAGLYRGSSPQSQGSGTSPTNIPSPARRKLSSPARSSPQFFTGPSSLPTIAGSPTKKGFGNEITFTIGTHGISPSEPLNMPFAKSRRVRASSCCLEGDGQQDISDSPGRDALIPRSASSSRLSEPLCLKAAFDNLAMNPGSSIEGIPGAIAASPPMHPTSFFIGSQSRRNSVLTEGSPSSQGSLTFATSPPNMEGPISFVAPELPEETLLAAEHTETVDRLNVILGIVEAIVEVAKSRSVPLAESIYNQGSSIFSNSQVCFVSENYRLAEQLVLYTRSLELLNAALTMAKEEFSAARLKPSNAVRTVLQELNRVYHLCLTKSRQLCEGSPLQSLDIDLNSAMITADKLMYSYAIEQCQSAGMDEMFGNTQECLQRYRTAQMLLHGLCLQAGTDHDRNLLLKFKNALDQRLLFLERQQTPVTPMIGL
ncbi:serine/threonine-protein kinase ULK2 isoform X1 [Strongylocentrotus purpuratus]|uniref:Protein kinase domain-containing protein n=1 Tax=Strongylocentrotus purpuratus TaxID=7668 RepID=A0A7M7HKX4_STRPU|nr:serine/threonine-protein kinase ULK2 isoform X1 [Strongylocentrotus purpuratus]